MSMQVINKRKNQRGYAVIMTALTMLVSLPLVGLAVDVSTLYMIKTKLQQAVDAGALAGARALANGSTVAQQAANAESTATQFFNANFPTGFWGTTNINLAAPTVDSTSVPNYRSVTTSATVTAPLYFLRVLGQNTTLIAASSQAGRRDVAMVLVLDRSSSMNYPFMGTTACAIMVTDAAQFLNYFAPGRDMVGLVVFGSSVYNLYPPTTSFTTPNANGDTAASLIGKIACGGNTNTDEAMYQAYEQLVTVGSGTRANVIVLMTDGRPNGFTGNYTNLRQSPASCKVTNGTSLIGEIEQWAGGPYATGTTAGLSVETTGAVDASGDGNAPPNSSGCVMDQNNRTNISGAPQWDLTAMPQTDIHGNSTVGTYSENNPNAPYNSSPDNLSVTSPQQIEVASVNAVDNMATVIRSNTALNTNIYTIALEGNAPNDPPDTILLRKMSNDPTMQNDPSTTAQNFWTQQNTGGTIQTVGYFVDAPDPSQLLAAFNSIAERIVVRLAR
jgi:Flp pilus assembly protein TadG